MRRREGTFCASFAKLAAILVAVLVFPRGQRHRPRRPDRARLQQLPRDAHEDSTSTSTATSPPTSSANTPGTTPAYSIDGDADNFSATELANIHTIWQSVVGEVLAVQRERHDGRPGLINNYEHVHVVIGGDGAWYGEPSGGVAVLSGYQNSAFPNVCFVFPAHLGNGNPKYVAEAAAHEAGHAFGLRHQSVFDSNHVKTAEYNPGTFLKAPIMGVSYHTDRGTWWHGPSTQAATFLQDDLDLLSRFGTQRPNFGYRADDFGSTLAAASPLAVDPEFNLSGTASSSG